MCLVKLKLIMVVTKQQKMVAYTYRHFCDLVIPQIPNTLIQTLRDNESFQENTWSIIWIGDRNMKHWQL